MLRTYTGGSQKRSPGGGEKRFSCIVARDSDATSLLHGRAIVSAGGELLGRVKSILIDSHNRQLRYVVMTPQVGRASVAIPWHALYFDSALARLVFYTFT